MKKVISLFLVLVVTVSLAACGGNGDTDDPPVEVDCTVTPEHEDCQEEPELDCNVTPDHPDCEVDPGEPTIIRFGSHWIPELDPNWVDPLTGEPYMAEDARLAGLVALERVLEELNVEIEFIEYTGDIREQFLQSVIAQDPVVDIGLMWGGSQNTLLGQNVLQDLNDYVDSGVFEGHEWALADPLFGKYKFMNFHLGSDGTGFTEWPLVYNVTMIDQCPGAKAIGNPSVLWTEGEWTWDTMEDMLEALYVCYNDVPGPERPEYTISPFSTDFRASLSGFLASNGEYAVRPDGTLGYDSPQTIEVVDLFLDWYDRGLMDTSFWNDLSNEPGWLWDSDNFGYGETVFTTCASWLVESEGAWMAQRGEKMGIVPYPVGPSATETGDTIYRNPNAPVNQWGVLKGVDAETSELAIRTAILYFEEYYKALGNVPTVDDYWDTLYEDVAHRMFDTLDPDHGQAIVQSLKDQMATATRGVDMATTYGVYYTWTGLIGDLIKGFKQDYTTEVAKIIPNLQGTVSSLGAIIESDQIRDTIGPSVENGDEDLAFPVGTDLTADDFTFGEFTWEDYLSVTDNMSVIDYSTLEFVFELLEYNDAEDPDKITGRVTENIDFSVPGRYYMTVTAYDENENEGEQSFIVVIYDDTNTTAPVFTVKDVVFAEVVGADLAEYYWEAYVDDARDTNGIPVTSNITADVSNVNTVSPGEYDVVLTITDYAGNVSTQTVKFRIFDDQETDRPTLEQKAGVDIDLVVGTTLITVDWSDYFNATDTLGGSTAYDIASEITLIDYGDFDNSTVGSYDVTLSVSDYAGNETTLVVTINIISE
jgi:predicted small lipoprotein YifL